MADKFVYEAKFINNEIIVDKYLVVKMTSATVKTLTQEGLPKYFPNDFFRVAFSQEDAISFLINSYSDTIIQVNDKIKDLENELKFLKESIPELMYEQRKVQIKAKRW